MIEQDKSIFKIQSECNHELVYDYGYIKMVCNKCKVSTSRELAHYRNLRCIICGEDIHAHKDEEMFDRNDGLIDSSSISFYDLQKNIEDKSEEDVIQYAKKYLKRA